MIDVVQQLKLKRGLLASPGEGDDIVGEEEGGQEKEEDRTECSQVQSAPWSKACCCSWRISGRLGSLSCRRRPPSDPPPPQLPAPASQHNLAAHPSTRAPAMLGCWVCRETGRRQPAPLCQVLSGTDWDLGSYQGPALRRVEATRLSALRTLFVSNRPLTGPFCRFPSAQATQLPAVRNTEMHRTLF